MAHPESQFTHPACEECWQAEHGTTTPTRLRAPYRVGEICCRCGKKTTSGIYVRALPSELLFCAANHRTEQEST